MSFDKAREFLARALPWPEDGRGFINIHWTFQKEGADKPLWTGRAFTSANDAVRYLEWITKQPTNRDVYVCMSRQSQCQERTGKNGKTYRAAIREGDNALMLKSFFIDVDVKEGSYPTTKDAVKAFGEFRRAADLPTPTFVVASGSGGFHAHWVLSEAIDRSEWLRLSHKLVAAARQHGLHFDSQCTIDAARLLRVPDTRNFKSDPPKGVTFLLPPGEEYTLERIERALTPYESGYRPEPSLPARAPLQGVSDLAAGIEVHKAPPVKLDDVATECAFIRDAIATGGEEYPNPLWNLTTLISVFTEGGRDDAHRMASGHPGYTQESTDELFDRKQQDRERKNLGWPSCQTIAASGCTACNVCPHRMDGKSPLNFGSNLKPVPAKTIKPSNDLPPHYVRDADGFVFLLVPQEDGSNDRVMVAPYPITDGWLQRNPWHLNFTLKINDDITSQIHVPFELLPTKEPFFKFISNQGVNLQEQYMRRFKEFIMAWVDKLRQGRNSVVTSSPFGWTINNGTLDGFSFGGTVFMPNEERPAANPNPLIQIQYAPTGERQPWITAAKMITDQRRPGLDLILASAFAAPLVRFTGQRGLLISSYSLESGIGKSTAVAIAQAVWGNPVKGVQQLNDTQNSVVNKLGEIKNLPLYWDELKTEEDTRKFVNLAFQLSSGKEKSRLTAQASQKEVGTWETMMLCASNDSLIDFITRATKMTTAGLMRVLEYTLTPGSTGQIDKTAAALMVSKLNDNHGVIGMEYAEFLGRNHAQVDIDMALLSARLADRLKTDAEERFWHAAVVCLVQGALYANKLGFTDINVTDLEDFLVTCVSNMRNERASQTVDMRKQINVSNVLTQFLNSMRTKHTLFTNKIHVAKGKPPTNSILVQRDTSKLDGIYVQVGLEDGLLRISSYQLREWLAKSGYSNHVFLKALEKEFGMHQTVGRLGSGTDYATGSEYLLQIHVVGTPLAEIAAVEEAA